MKNWIWFVLFIGSIFLANFLIRNIGVVCKDNICLIPVGFGLMAPSGVLAVGLGFTFRDIVQRTLGLNVTILGIGLGAFISSFLGWNLALASGAAFLLSEFFDLLVYTPLQERKLVLAVVLSNIAGLIVDSVVFLHLAFQSLQFLEGQILGKFWMTLLVVPVIWFLHRK